MSIDTAPTLLRHYSDTSDTSHTQGSTLDLCPGTAGPVSWDRWTCVLGPLDLCPGTAGRSFVSPPPSFGRAGCDLPTSIGHENSTFGEQMRRMTGSWR